MDLQSKKIFRPKMIVDVQCWDDLVIVVADVKIDVEQTVGSSLYDRCQLGDSLTTAFS